MTTATRSQSGMAAVLLTLVLLQTTSCGGAKQDSPVSPTPVVHTFSVSGRVIDETGLRLAGITLTLTPGSITVMTDANGEYSIEGVPNGNYVLTPSLPGLTFSPANHTLTMNGANLGAQDFVARAETESGWIRTWGGAAAELGHSIAVDTSGNVFVTGYTKSFGAGGGDLVLLKYSSSGALLWQKTWGGDLAEAGYGVAVGPSGDVYVTGDTQSYGSSPSDDIGNRLSDLVLLKFSATGSLLWQRTWGGRNYDWGSGIAIDDSGDVYVTGYTQQASYYDPGELVLLKFSSSGGLIWQRTWAGAVWDAGLAVAVDGSGDVHVTGYSFESTDPRIRDVAILKYSPAGNILWQKTWGATNRLDDRENHGRDIAVDNSGNAFLVGYTHSFEDSEAGVYLIKYTPEGNLAWQRTWRATYSSRGESVAVDESGSAYVTGYVEKSSAGPRSTDLILLKYSASGDLLRQRTWGGAAYEEGSAIAVDAGGWIYITGRASNVYGSWQDIIGAEAAPVGVEAVPSGDETTPDWIALVAEGDENVPEGVHDEGGGNSDILVMKIDQSEF